MESADEHEDLLFLAEVDRIENEYLNKKLATENEMLGTIAISNASIFGNHSPVLTEVRAAATSATFIGQLSTRELNRSSCVLNPLQEPNKKCRSADSDIKSWLIKSSVSGSSKGSFQIKSHPEHQHVPKHLTISNPFLDQSTDILILPTNPEVRKYQRDIILSAIVNNTLVCLPTGLGKTLIAAVVMYNYLRWFPDKCVVFMAPTRPLVHQQLQVRSI